MGGIAFEVNAGGDATIVSSGDMTISLFGTDAGMGLPALHDKASTIEPG